MPSRLIKESICTSESVNAMTDFQFRLWVSLITYVDDFGRGDARPAIIKGACFPLRDRIASKDIDAALAGLAGIGCVGLYEVDGKPYLYFPSWEKHQVIRNKRSKFPAPPENINLQTIENKCKQMQANVSVIQSNPIQSESISESESESNKGAKRADRSPLQIAMDDFAAARKAMRKPLTDKARELTLRELEKLAPGDEQTQIAIINQSIQLGWQGVVPRKSEDAKQGKRQPQKETSNALADDTDRLMRMRGSKGEIEK